MIRLSGYLRRPVVYGVSTVCAAISIAGCVSSPAPTETSPAADWMDLIDEATVSGVDPSGPIKLADGVYEGPPYVAGGASRPRTVLIRQTMRRGDLDAKAGDEVAVLLSSSSGGSGEFIYLAVFAYDEGAARNIGTAAVGDRVDLIRMNLTDRNIVLDVVEAGPTDAMCCPTQLTRKEYRLELGRLEHVSDEPMGKLSLSILEGPEWSLVEMDRQRLPEGVKPATLKVADGRAAGFSGCNNYTGSIEETSPGNIRLGQQAVTMKACLEPHASYEREYLRRLSRASSYSFVAGRLALSWEDGEGGQGVLLFER